MKPWYFPLRSFCGDIPNHDHEGGFGYRRQYDIHTGVDLYAAHGQIVCAVADGVVVAVEDFTGPKAGSPWWRNTQAVLVESEFGVVCYGEIKTSAKVGDVIKAGHWIGTVETVLKKYKGKPTSMLHFELYKPGTKSSVTWSLSEDKPECLLDPTRYLKESLISVSTKNLKRYNAPKPVVEVMKGRNGGRITLAGRRIDFSSVVEAVANGHIDEFLEDYDFDKDTKDLIDILVWGCKLARQNQPESSQQSKALVTQESPDHFPVFAGTNVKVTDAFLEFAMKGPKKAGLGKFGLTQEMIDLIYDCYFISR